MRSYSSGHAYRISAGPSGAAKCLTCERDSHGRIKRGPTPPTPRGRIPQHLSLQARMQRRLATRGGQALNVRRKVLTGPVVGLIKRARGFWRFLLRGLAQVQGEWTLISTGRTS